MKKVFTLLIAVALLMLTGLSNVQAVTADPITTIGAPNASVCGVIDVPVTVQNFNNIGAISLKLNYDANALSYTGVTLNPAISNSASVYGNAGVFTLGNFGGDITLPDDAVLFTLHFTILPAGSGSTSLIWSAVAEDCEYAGPGGTPVYSSTFNNLSLWTIPEWPVKNTNTGLGYCNIPDAVYATETLDGHTITVADGTYVLSSTLSISKQLTITGETEAGVIIDASGNGTGYGVLVQADNVTLEKFTLLPPVVTASLGTSGGGGYAIHASFNHTSPYSMYNNLKLQNITIENGNRTSFDIHGYDGVTLNYLTAKGNVYGNGISLTGCMNGTVTNCTTSGNTWGGIAVYCSKDVYLNTASSNITIDFDQNSIGEFIYIQDEFGLVNTNINVSNWTYGINNEYSATGNFTAYIDKAKTVALNFGAGLNIKFGNMLSYCWDPTITTHFVGPGMAIQRAIDKALVNYTVEVAAGTYEEQVTVDSKSITLTGAGAATTFINAPVSMGVSFTTSYDAHAVVGAINDASLVMTGFTVDGLGRGNSNYKMMGVAFRNSGGEVSNCEILNIENTPFSGAQHGVGVYAYNDDDTSRDITISNNKIKNFQKNAMALNASPSTPMVINVSGNTIIGHGATTVTAQNGIQTYGVLITGTVSGNTISGIAYDNTDASTKWAATSILNYYSNINITTNTITGAHMGIYNIDASGSISGNNLTIEKVGVYAFGIIGTDPPKAVPQPYDGTNESTEKSGSMVSSVPLNVEINDNTVVFVGIDNTATYGIEVDAGWGPNDLLVSGTGNTVSDFEVGFEIYKCESGCDVGEFTGVSFNNNRILDNTIGIRSNVDYLTVNATCNWYGTADYNQIFPLIIGNVTFVSYLTTDDIVTPFCDGVVPPVKNLIQNLYYYSIQEAIDAITTVDNDVIEVQVADFTEPGFVRVTKSLTIQGQGKTATVVRCNVNTTTAGHGVDAAIWISGSAGKTITIKEMTLDATGKDVKYAVVLRSSGEVENVAFNEIKHSTSPYFGIAVQVLDGSVDIKGCSFTEIGRIGVHYRNGVIANASISGTYDNNTYTGKGAGDWLDYALDISGGTTVTVSNSTITGNTGVAVSDGSTSAGVMATTYFPYGLNVPNAVTITGNTLTGNSTGISVGYDANDVSVVTAHNNKISGNTDYGVESTGPTVDATENWWGHETGPYNDPLNVCGQGNAVTANVDFHQWWDSDAMNNLYVLSAPQEIGGPVPTGATVECVADAVEPTLPVVKDYCGTVLEPAAPVITADVDCEGTKTYTYTYTDAYGEELVWVFTYTIDHTIAPVVPADGGSTVECLTDAVVPQIQQLDQQQLLVQSNPIWNQQTAIGQSFTCATSGYLTTIDVQVGSVTGTHNFTLQIYEGHGIGGTLLYSEPHSLSATGWQSLILGDGAAPYLEAGTQYTFWLTSFTFNTLGLLCHSPDVYAGGTAMDGCTIEGGVDWNGTHYDPYGWLDWPDYDLVFKTYMSDTPAATPTVTDVCGSSITPVLVSTVDDPSSLTCAGTRTYNYTYTDCAGLETPWKYVYTIEHSTLPTEVGGSVAISANVECASDAVAPSNLPVVQDVCGNVLDPSEATIETNLENCEGNIVYKYVYTDCSSLTFEWSFTYNVEDVTAPTITCPSDITVNMNSGCTATNVVLGTPTVADNCNGNLTVTNNAPTSFNEGETIVTWTVKDCAGNESTCEQTVTVVKNTLSGTVMYNNSAKSPMEEVTLKLTPGNVEFTTGDDGTYSFTGLCAGTYTIEVVDNTNDVGGINSTDAGAANYWGTSGGAIDYVKFLAGDVINDLYINSTNAMKIQRYFVFAEAFVRAPWSYWSKGLEITSNTNPFADPSNHPSAITVDVSGGDETGFDIYAMCTGDFNGSLTGDRLKSANLELALTTEGNLQKGINQEFKLPLKATSTMEVGAVSMILSIPTNLIEVQSVKINGSNIDATWTMKGDELRIGWNSVTPVYVYENESLVTLSLKTRDAFTFGNSLDIDLVHNSLNELADANFTVINGATLKAAKIGNGVVGVNEELDNTGLTFSNYPNPFANQTTLQYSIPEKGRVSINIYNQLGQLVNSMVEGNRLAGQHSIPNCGNGLQPGIYIAKLRLTNQNLDIEGIIKLNVVK